MLHMQAIWHIPAAHADKGTGGSRAGRAQQNLPVGMQSLGASPPLTAQLQGHLFGVEGCVQVLCWGWNYSP